ncbi:alpha/beta hydrolase [Streptomyces cyaneofuscatus]|uniref:alpha/beta hydrolase n=1 Tax=Streptomyces cyaneofuscatus TaxID=66883 RepID=UPI0036C5727C
MLSSSQTAATGADHPVQGITLDAAGIPLSALHARPATAPRATVVAIHGAGMRAGYFHHPVSNDLSLLALGTQLGFSVLALDRPGYGASAGALPQGQTLAEQTDTLGAALHTFADRHELGAGLFLLAHSYGGKLALSTAARPPDLPVLGCDISGCGYLFAREPGSTAPDQWQRDMRGNNWGPLGLYPTDTFRLSRSLLTAMPPREAAEIRHWPQTLESMARRIRVPLRFTFAEHERRWRHDREALAALRTVLSAAPVTTAHQATAGHNISLGRTARTYHLKALTFFEEQLAREMPAELPAGPRPPIGFSAA